MMNRISYELEGVKITSCGSENTLHINLFEAYNPGNGQGTKALKLIKESVKSEGKNRHIVVLPLGRKAKKFWSKNGFIPISGGRMIWRPNFDEK